MSSSKPLVAKTGILGWGSMQLTYKFYRNQVISDDIDISFTEYWITDYFKLDICNLLA